MNLHFYVLTHCPFSSPLLELKQVASSKCSEGKGRMMTWRHRLWGLGIGIRGPQTSLYRDEMTELQFNQTFTRSLRPAYVRQVSCS